MCSKSCACISPILLRHELERVYIQGLTGDIARIFDQAAEMNVHRFHAMHDFVN